MSIIAQAIYKIIGHILEVLQNPALNETNAIDDLRKIIELLIIKWVVRQCAKALESPVKHWQLLVIKTIKA